MSSSKKSVHSDKELMSLLREGNRVAFSEIYKRYWMVIYGQVFRMLQDEEETRDIVQEVFTTLWLKNESLASSDNLAGLLYTTARRKVLDLFARRKVQGTYLDSLDSYLHQYSDDIIEDLNAKELMAAFEREIEKLPPRMKAIFKMRVNDHLSYKDIAEKLGISDLTVKKQVNNAINLIKPKLQSHVGWISILLWLGK